MPNTYVALNSFTVTTPVASISFNSIPQTYTDLVLVAQGRTTTSGGNSDIIIGLNGDYSGIYSRLWTSTSTGSNSHVTGYNFNFGGMLTSYMTGGGAAANQFSNDVTHIMNYANTTTFKPYICKNLVGNGGTFFTVGQYNSRNAISSMTITSLDSTNFATNTTFALYGITAA
jgi:hypothetical protein